MSKVIIITAPSGSGKTTLVKHLLSVYSQLEFSISATTRALRTGEINGKDYYFLTLEEFNTRISHHEFVEYEEVYHGAYYGTLKSELQRIWDKNHTVVFDVDVKGAINLKKKFADDALSIFIKPPSIEELQNRLLSRASESIEKIQERLAKSKSELEYESYFDLTVVNDKLEKAQQEIEDAVFKFIS